MTITYREAFDADCATILEFIRELAVYEKLEDDVVATEDDLRATMFGPNPHTFCFLAESDGVPVGFALGFYNYSTFQGKYGLYLEDLFVRETHRNAGIGKGFFRMLAQKALDENCGRIQWWCLNWNKPSIEFYKKLGAVAMDEWTVFRMEGESIARLANADGQKAA